MLVMLKNVTLDGVPVVLQGEMFSFPNIVMRNAREVLETEEEKQELEDLDY
jgi:hypothetical protein